MFNSVTNNTNDSYDISDKTESDRLGELSEQSGPTAQRNRQREQLYSQDAFPPAFSLKGEEGQGRAGPAQNPAKRKALD